MKNRLYIMVFILFLPFGSMAGWFSPDNYEECILDKLPDVESRGATIQLKRACKAKYKTKYIQPLDIRNEADFRKWVKTNKFSEEKAIDCKLSNITKKTERIAAIIISSACESLYPSSKKPISRDESAHLNKIGRQIEFKKAEEKRKYEEAKLEKEKIEKERVNKVRTEKERIEYEKQRKPLGYEMGVAIPFPYAPTTVVPKKSSRKGKTYTKIGDPSLYDQSRKNPNKFYNPKCTLKPVMTDEDYRLCGITPPN